MVGGLTQAQDTPDILQLVKALESEEFLDDPAQIMMWVEIPRSVTKGEVVSMRITIENARDTDVFKLSSIFLESSFISGFKTLELSPEPRNKSKSLGDLTLEYPIDIPAGEARDFEIRLRAKGVGVYIGDVDIYEGEQFLTRAAQIRVQ